MDGGEFLQTSHAAGTAAWPVLVVEMAGVNSQPDCSASGQFPAGRIADDLHCSAIGPSLSVTRYEVDRDASLIS